MVNRVQQGAIWEKAVARFVNGERARVRIPDTGDITGIPGVVIECKAQGLYKFPEWIKQLQSAVDTAGVDLGLLAVKQYGKTSVEKGFWLIDPRCVPYVLDLARRAHLADSMASPVLE